MTTTLRGDELKNVIDDALEGFQMLISESFKDTETESPWKKLGEEP